MAALIAILLAIFVLPPYWGLVAILAGLTVEVGEAWLWIHLSRRRRAVTGAEGLIGRRAQVVEACQPEGKVRVQGELWKGCCDSFADAGQPVRVLSVDADGLTLHVVPEGTRPPPRA
jgi:membrane protein implicated in regulation of membrane protease activity